MAAIYFIALLLFRLPIVAITAASLFGLDPLANQPVVVADWVFTVPQCGVALSLLFLGLSLKVKRGSLLWLLASLITAGTSVLMYEPTIVSFGMIYLCIGVWLLLNGVRSIEKKYWIVLLGFTVLYAAGWMALRARYLPRGSMHPYPFTTILGSLTVYAIGPMQLIDPVLAHTVLIPFADRGVAG